MADRLRALGAFKAYYLDLGHISPGWEKMFGLGLSGLIEEARGELVLFSDADLSTPIEELPRLMGELDAGAQIAIGSRSGSRPRRASIQSLSPQA